MENILVLYDSDSVYTQRMMDYIQKKRYKAFHFSGFTDRDKLVDYIAKQRIDLLVTSDISIDKELIEAWSLNKEVHIIYLSPDPVLGLEEGSKVYKYQPASKVLSEIISIISREKKKPLKFSEEKNSIKIISVFSPLRGLSKSQFAWSLAEDLSNYCKVLFIPMEILPAHLSRHPTTGKQETKEEINYKLSQLIYYLKEDNKEVMSMIDSSISYQGSLSYISGISHGFDLISLERSEGKILLDNIKKNTNYEFLIFYFSIYTEFSQEIMVNSDTCFITTEDNEYEEAIYREWQRQVKFAGYKLDDNRFRQLHISSMDNANKASKEIMKEVASINNFKVAL